MVDEVNGLVPTSINGITIHHVAYPCECDGKLKCHWCDVSTNHCWICGANEVQRKLRFHKMFTDDETNPEDRLAMGPSPCHMEMRALEWCIVASTHQDFKSRSEKHPLYEVYQPARLKSLQVRSKVRYQQFLALLKISNRQIEGRSELLCQM